MGVTWPAQPDSLSYSDISGLGYEQLTATSAHWLTSPPESLSAHHVTVELLSRGLAPGTVVGWMGVWVGVGLEKWWSNCKLMSGLWTFKDMVDSISHGAMK